MTENGIYNIESNSPKDVLQITWPLENGFIHINASIDRLKRDINNRVAELKIDPNTAKEVLEKTTFELEESPLFDKLGVIGHVGEDEKTGEKELALNTRAITKIIDDPNLIFQLGIDLGFKSPANMPLEAKIQGVTQFLNVVWQHEKEHLVEKMDPKLEEANKKSKNLIRKAYQGAALLIGTGALSFLTQELLPMQYNDRVMFFLVGKCTAIGGLLLYLGSTFYDARFSPSEQRSFKTGKLVLNSGQINSPFSVSFEKN